MPGNHSKHLPDYAVGIFHRFREALDRIPPYVFLKLPCCLLDVGEAERFDTLNPWDSVVDVFSIENVGVLCSETSDLKAHRFATETLHHLDLVNDIVGILGDIDHLGVGETLRQAESTRTVCDDRRHFVSEAREVVDGLLRVPPHFETRLTGRERIVLV